MRSRYTAYAQADHAYLIRTCHPSSRADMADFEGQEDIAWTGLEVLATEAGGPADDQGMVEFIARFRIAGADQSLHERSSFVRQDGQWFYLDGEIIPPEPVRTVKIGRNQPCPCGSGRKFKKCCRNEGNG